MPGFGVMLEIVDSFLIKLQNTSSLTYSVYSYLISIGITYLQKFFFLAGKGSCVVSVMLIKSRLYTMPLLAFTVLCAQCTAGIKSSYWTTVITQCILIFNSTICEM